MSQYRLSTTKKMTLLYSHPLNFKQKLHNYITRYVFIMGWILGCLPFKWHTKTGKYVQASPFLRKLLILPVSITILESIRSYQRFKDTILIKFIHTEMDMILNLIILSQFYLVVIMTSIICYKNQRKVLNILNQVIYLKRLVLKLNKNPLLDQKMSTIYLNRWTLGGLIITFIANSSSSASKYVPVNPFYVATTVIFFCIHYIWYTCAVSCLLCASLFASHLIRVVTIEMKDILTKYDRINRRLNEIKPGQVMTEMANLSDRVDYLSFCYMEIWNFVQNVVTIMEKLLLLVSSNIFFSIITDTGNLYVRLFKSSIDEQDVLEIRIFFGYLWFAFNELHFMHYGAEKFLLRFTKLQKIVGQTTLMTDRKVDDRFHKSVSVGFLV